LATAFAALAMGLVAARMPLATPSLTLRKGQLFRSQLLDGAVYVLAIASSTVLFQVAAVRHAPALSGAAPMLILLGFSVSRYRDLA